MLTHDYIWIVTGRYEADGHDDGDEGGLGHRCGSSITFSPMRQIVQEGGAYNWLLSFAPQFPITTLSVCRVDAIELGTN